ncbi:DUF2637 domain-containing protein [Nocardia cyriacigeorgica]|uniref:DUF2637 domain-containing protein n=1 Tax=Nocardia cyriacigeorgica TaxID=135487 RepID=UPI000CEA3F0C|nr:DUF2637 domain-containing protein [Nocardia cyriacigeorgica]AVH21223.1 excisionase [Nocardia cyriacigeorgica]MBF6499678.1 DUF2637 domain-containing protein [Nocardia cyriacigeorgica]PPJ07646.1 excisionase [Nocardia cyriacigeorgica]
MSTHETAASFRIARGFAVVTIIAVGVAAFVLSFASLRDLAILAHVPARWAWLFPVIVDGTIIQATVSALALAKSPERRWFTGVLVAGAVVSIAGNSLHAVAAGQELPAWASALVAAIAPISLLADTHGLAVLFRAAHPEPAPAAEPAAEPESAEEPDPQPIPEPEPGPVPVAEPAPVPAAAVSPAPVVPSPPVRSSRPVQAMLPIAVPVGGV